MKHPDLIPLYSHLLCREELSEDAEDASQHLFQMALDAGLLQLDRDFDGHEMWPEPTMMRLLEIATKAADLRLSRAARRLEAILLREFPSQVASKAGDWALETEAVDLSAARSCTR